MSVPPVPPPLEELGHRPFSFYPPIVGVEHNEWTYRKATWSEVLVSNRKSRLEVCIPRVFLGELSRIEEPIAIVGLNKELEYKAGAIVPHQRRVIQMPRAVNDGSVNPSHEIRPVSYGPARVVGIRLEHKSESKIGRLLLVSTAVAVAGAVGAVALFQSNTRRVAFAPIMQSEFQFSAADDYNSVVSRLGPPADDKLHSAVGEPQYRKLSYPKLGINVILVGSDRERAHYLGQLDWDGRVIHAISANAEVQLRRLRRF